jgi:hypothetical protein
MLYLVLVEILTCLIAYTVISYLVNKLHTSRYMRGRHSVGTASSTYASVIQSFY